MVSENKIISKWICSFDSQTYSITNQGYILNISRDFLFIYFHFFTGLKEGDAVKVKFKNGRGYLTDIFKYYYRGNQKHYIF